MQVPGLRNELNMINNHAPEYLIQEYMNDTWEPMTVDQMHDLASSYKLRYVCSATLTDNFEQFLHESVREAVLSEPDPTVRQSLQDLATNKRFRRDIFCRGVTSMTNTEVSQQFRQVRIALRETPGRTDNRYSTSFGSVIPNNKVDTVIEESLASGPQELGTLQDLNSFQELELAQAIFLLLEANRIGIDRGDASLQAHNICQEVNRNLTTMQMAGHPYCYRVASAIGTAINFSLSEALIESALQSDPEADPVPALIAGLHQMNIAIERDVADVVNTYLMRRPALQRLGVVGP
jgi:hypothetical protein